MPLKPHKVYVEENPAVALVPQLSLDGIDNGSFSPWELRVRLHFEIGTSIEMLLPTTVHLTFSKFTNHRGATS